MKSTDNLTDFEKAVKARDEFLEQHPHMKEFQKHIDNTLDAAGEDFENRLKALQGLVAESRHKVEELQELARLLKISKEDGII